MTNRSCVKYIRVQSILLIVLFFGLGTLTSRAQNKFQKAGDSLFHVNKYVEAQQEYLLALKQAEKNADTSSIVQAEKSIALCHYYLRDKPTALKWLYRALENARVSVNEELLNTVKYYIAVMYIEASIIDSAEKYTGLAAAYWQKVKDYKNLSRALSALSDMYINKLMKDKAYKTMQEANRYAEMSGDSGVMAFAALKGCLYNRYVTKDYKRALEYINKAENLWSGTKFKEDLLYVYRFKAQVLSLLGDSLADYYMQRWFEFKDSIFNSEKAEALAKYETLYETEKKESQIREQYLIIQNEKQLRRLYAFIAASVLLLALVLIVLYRNYNKQKTQRLLQEQQDKSMQEIFNAEQNERIRIARDLHDSIGQKLSVARMLLPRDSHSTELQKIRTYLDETAQEVRSISHNLIPEILNFGLVKAIEELCDQINATDKIIVEYTPRDEPNTLKLDKRTELSLYRIIQEILNNIIKHSQTNKLSLDLKSLPGMIQIDIEDKGVGFDTIAISQSKGIGWRNIFARIKLINGSITIKSEKNKGSHFLLNIPIA